MLGTHLLLFAAVAGLVAPAAIRKEDITAPALKTSQIQDLLFMSFKHGLEVLRMGLNSSSTNATVDFQEAFDECVLMSAEIFQGDGNQTVFFERCNYELKKADLENNILADDIFYEINDSIGPILKKLNTSTIRFAEQYVNLLETTVFSECCRSTALQEAIFWDSVRPDTDGTTLLSFNPATHFGITLEAQEILYTGICKVIKEEPWLTNFTSSEKLQKLDEIFGITLNFAHTDLERAENFGEIIIAKYFDQYMRVASKLKPLYGIFQQTGTNMASGMYNLLRFLNTDQAELEKAGSPLAKRMMYFRKLFFAVPESVKGEILTKFIDLSNDYWKKANNERATDFINDARIRLCVHPLMDYRFNLDHLVTQVGKVLRMEEFADMEDWRKRVILWKAMESVRLVPKEHPVANSTSVNSTHVSISKELIKLIMGKTEKPFPIKFEDLEDITTLAFKPMMNSTERWWEPVRRQLADNPVAETIIESLRDMRTALPGPIKKEGMDPLSTMVKAVLLSSLIEYRQLGVATRENILRSAIILQSGNSGSDMKDLVASEVAKKFIDI